LKNNILQMYLFIVYLPHQNKLKKIGEIKMKRLNWLWWNMLNTV